jgi:hypothetical protein
MIEKQIIVTCGATVGDILQRMVNSTGKRPRFEKIWPNDSRGDYGDYAVWLDDEVADMIVAKYRCAGHRRQCP